MRKALLPQTCIAMLLNISVVTIENMIGKRKWEGRRSECRSITPQGNARQMKEQNLGWCHLIMCAFDGLLSMACLTFIPMPLKG